MSVCLGTDTPVHRPENPAGSTLSSTSGLSLREQLERQGEIHSSTEDGLKKKKKSLLQPKQIVSLIRTKIGLQPAQNMALRMQWADFAHGFFFFTDMVPVPWFSR